MASRNGKKQARKSGVGRRLLVGLSAGGGAFLAAAAMATGSAITAAPAHADFEDLLDPIIQPFLTSLTDSIAVFDPAAALDLTSWSDSVLASLNTSFDFALPSTDSALAAAAEPAASATTGVYDLPLILLGSPATEPAVNASIDGGSSVPLLVDTGSSGLVVPYTDLGSNYFSQIEALFNLGSPTGLSQSGYSGGVDYLYLTYNNVQVDYAGGLTTDGPVDVEVYSWNPSDITSYFTNDAFQEFLGGNSVQGILGLGENTAGPTTSPFESFGNVTINVPGHELIVGGDPVTSTATLSGAPISGDWISINGGPAEEVANDIDSGGVTGTIPSDYLSTAEYNSTTDLVNPGTKIALYADKAETNLLYSYTVTADNDPIVVSPGTTMDSGVEPFLLGPISMEYSPAGTGTTIFGY
jgi:hypothetical protein